MLRLALYMLLQDICLPVSLYPLQMPDEEQVLHVDWTEVKLWR